MAVLFETFSAPSTEKGISKAMKSVIHNAIVVIIMSSCLGLQVHAQGIPVIDVAAIAQAILQLQAWEQQYAQMVQSLQQQNQLIQSATGSRGLGLINNNITSTVLPSNSTQTISQMSTHGALDTYAAQSLGQLRQALQVRSSQIQGLMGQISQTQDPKAIAELQSRIQAEQVMATNEAKEAQALQLQIEAQRRAIDEQHRQEIVNRVTP